MECKFRPQRTETLGCIGNALELDAKVEAQDILLWATRLCSEMFAQRLAGRGIEQPYLFYLFGVQAYGPVEDKARQLGLRVLDPDGKRVTPTPVG